MLKRSSLGLVFAIACHHPATPPAPPLPPASVTGIVHFMGTPCANPAPGCDGPMAGYEVRVLAKDGKTLVASATTDAAGRYTVSVPAGDYTIFTQRGIRAEDLERHDLTVTSGATTTLDLTIDTGVR
jgi:hypothetical protein